jgi:tellurite resistance protein
MDAPVSSISNALEVLCASSERASQGRSCVVDLLTLVATADGEIDTEEMEVLTRALGVLIGGDPLPEVVQLLIGSSVDAIRNEGRESRILKVATGLRECRAEEEGVHVAIAIAYASYGFSPAERAVVGAIAHAAGLPPSRVTALIREVRREVDPG